MKVVKGVQMRMATGPKPLSLGGGRFPFSLKYFLALPAIALATIGVIAALNPKTDTTAAPSPPVVSIITPDNGPIAGGTKITVEGSGFLGEYEEVEYIYLDGGSYIQTDITQLNRNLNVRIMPDAYDGARYVVGAANGSGTQIFAVQRTGGNQYTFHTGAATAGSSGPTSSTTTTIPATGMVDIAFDWARQAHINGSQYPNDTGFIGAAVPNVASTYQIGATSPYTSYFKGRFYLMRLTGASSGSLEANLVPVRKTGTSIYGVVDTITGQFYGNSGTGTITGGAVVAGALAPDRPISVTIDDRACTGLEIISNTELTCHTPSGLSLGQKDVVVSNAIVPAETTTVVNGYEYALRLNSITPKFGDPGETSEIEIEGGVFSTPPDSYASASVSGIKFDSNSWITPGFSQIGSTRYEVDFKFPAATAAYNTGFIGSRSTGSSGSFLLWQLANGSIRSDYGSSGGVSTTYAGIRDVRTSAVIDDGHTVINNARTADRPKLNFSSLLPAEMLLGSLTTGSGYGTNSFSNYLNYGGIIYSAQICKERSIAESMGVIYQESPICDPPGAYDASTNPLGSAYSYAERNDRVLVRDLQAAIRTSDNVCGFYDMVTGEFLTNAGYGSLSCTKDNTDNSLEVPVELEVTFSYVDEDDQEQTGICTNPELLPGSTTKLSCTMPESPFPGDGQGRVDLTVYANGVLATSGTADADDFYYGSPLVVETISPNRGPIAGGQTVVIAGNNLQPSVNSVPDFDPETDWTDIEVTIGGSVCEFEKDPNDPTKLLDVSHYTNTSITCTTTANVGGISDIEVTLNYFDEIDQEYKTTSYLYGGALDPISGAITSGYLYEDDLFSIDPTEGPTTGGTVVTITANNAFLTTGTTRVYFGARLATNVSVSPDGKTITATTPANAPGKVDILVVQTGYAASLRSEAANAFEYTVGESNITFSPNRGYLSGGDTIIITGTFDTNTTATVRFGGVASPSVTVLSATQLEVVTPARAAAGRADIVVEQWGTTIGSATGTAGFLYIPPLTIVGISPNRGSTGGGTEVTITGQSFIPPGSTSALSLGSLTVTLGGSPCTVDADALETDYTDTTIRCTTSAHAKGIVDVAVSTASDSNHSDTFSSGYLYIETDLSLSVESVNINLSAPNTLGTGSTAISVRTNNPAGYSLTIRADDRNSSTSNDQSLSCITPGLENSKFNPLTLAGSLSAGTWGWGLGGSQPSTWNPISSADAALTSPTPHPSGPSEDGTAPDSYTLWFGANASWSQPACAYTGKVIITMVSLR